MEDNKSLAEVLKRDVLTRDRICKDCKELKSAEEFNLLTVKRFMVLKGRVIASLYRKTICKKCEVKRTKNWRIKNRAKFNRYHRKYTRNYRANKRNESNNKGIE